MALEPHLYPWIPAAAEVVNRHPLEDLVKGRGFEAARRRGQERLLQAVEGEIRPSVDPLISHNPDLEVLSHPFARMLLGCLRDTGLVRRYAVAEAKRAYARMLEEEPEALLDLGRELGLEASTAPPGKIGENGDGRAGGVWVHFARYADLTAGIAYGWKLVNRPVAGGRVRTSPREFARLLQEIVQRRLAEMPPAVPPEMCRGLQPYLEPVRESLQRFQRERTTLESVNPEVLPPCIRSLLENVGAGLTHPGRFALTTFMLNVGLPFEKLLAIYQQFPDYRSDITEYQVKHIGGQIGSRTEYTAPSCATMKSYGLCVNADNLCTRINEPPKKGHPLTYYRVKTGPRRPASGPRKTP
jgi:DNA primase large subunit